MVRLALALVYLLVFNVSTQFAPFPVRGATPPVDSTLRTCISGHGECLKSSWDATNTISTAPGSVTPSYTLDRPFAFGHGPPNQPAASFRGRPFVFGHPPAAAVSDTEGSTSDRFVPSFTLPSSGDGTTEIEESPATRDIATVWVTITVNQTATNQFSSISTPSTEPVRQWPSTWWFETSPTLASHTASMSWISPPNPAIPPFVLTDRIPASSSTDIDDVTETVTATLRLTSTVYTNISTSTSTQAPQEVDDGGVVIVTVTSLETVYTRTTVTSSPVEIRPTSFLSSKTHETETFSTRTPSTKQLSSKSSSIDTGALGPGTSSTGASSTGTSRTGTSSTKTSSADTSLSTMLVDSSPALAIVPIPRTTATEPTTMSTVTELPLKGTMEEHEPTWKEMKGPHDQKTGEGSTTKNLGNFTTPFVDMFGETVDPIFGPPQSTPLDDIWSPPKEDPETFPDEPQGSPTDEPWKKPKQEPKESPHPQGDGSPFGISRRAVPPPSEDNKFEAGGRLTVAGKVMLGLCIGAVLLAGVFLWLCTGLSEGDRGRRLLR